MRLHRFYMNTPINLIGGEKNASIEVADKEMVHQWRHVFRYNVGSQVILFDGSGVDYTCLISSMRNLGATVQVMKSVSTISAVPRRNVWLCVAIIKKDNFDWVVQKATELGVSHIVPMVCEHSEKRKLNENRMKKIAIESSEQSGRGDIPVIHPITTIAELFKSGVLPQDKVVFHSAVGESSSGVITFGQYKNAINPVSVAAFIGPEGGFSDKEMILFKSYNVPVISLGTQILRAETASVAVSALFLL